MKPTRPVPHPSSDNVRVTNSDSASIVQNFVEAVFNKGDLSQLENFIHPAYRYHSPNEEIVGIDALRTFIQALRIAFPDIRVEVTEHIGEGQKVCTRVVLTGTQLGEFIGIPPTGRSIQIDGVIISEIADGRIVQEWELLDQYSMLLQLGLLPEENAA